MISHSDNVKDVLSRCLQEWLENDRSIDDYVHELANAIFDALCITKAEQDKTGGYFMLHAGKKADVLYLDGDFTSTMLDSAQKSEDKETRPMTTEEYCQHQSRMKHLNEGAKYTSAEFKAFAKYEKVEETGRWYISLQTPICKYGQDYHKTTDLEQAKTYFVNGYYPMYLEDYEREEELDEVDKE